MSEHVIRDAEGILFTIAATVCNLGANYPYLMGAEVFVVLSPEHVHTVDASGFSRRDVQLYLYGHPRIPLATLKRGNLWGMHVWPVRMNLEQDDARLMPVVTSRDLFKILVCGGPGKHSSVLPGFRRVEGGDATAVPRHHDVMKGDAVRIVNPVGASSGAGQRGLAELPPRSNLRVGVLENTKPNAGRLLHVIAEGLAARRGEGTVLVERKHSVAAQAWEALLARLRALVHIGVTGTGD